MTRDRLLLLLRENEELRRTAKKLISESQDLIARTKVWKKRMAMLDGRSREIRAKRGTWRPS